MSVAAIDVSKLELVFAWGNVWGKLPNQDRCIGNWLDRLEPGTTVAMEATGRYHLPLANLAHARGHRVLVANPRRVKKFIQSTETRGKTDRTDAQAIARYIESQGSKLRSYAPAPELALKVRDLTRERQALTSSKAALSQSLSLSKQALQTAVRGLDQAIALVEKDLALLLADLPEYKLLLDIPGVGPVVAAGLLGLLLSHDFASADSFVAFLGMDPRPNDSGAKKGKRFISNQGDATVRKLAFVAGMSGMRTPAWQPYAQKQRDKGLSGTEVALIVGRKIARTAWSMYTRKLSFNPERISNRP